MDLRRDGVVRTADWGRTGDRCPLRDGRHRAEHARSVRDGDRAGVPLPLNGGAVPGERGRPVGDHGADIAAAASTAAPDGDDRQGPVHAEGGSSTARSAAAPLELEDASGEGGNAPAVAMPLPSGEALITALLQRSAGTDEHAHGLSRRHGELPGGQGAGPTLGRPATSPPAPMTSAWIWVTPSGTVHRVSSELALVLEGRFADKVRSGVEAAIAGAAVAASATGAAQAVLQRSARRAGGVPGVVMEAFNVAAMR